MPKNTLTKKVLAYQQTKQGMDWLMKELVVLIYRYKGLRRFSNEEKVEFMSFFYPALMRLINKFIPRGCSFELCLYTYLCYALKSYFREKHRQKIQQRMRELAERERATEICEQNRLKECFSTALPVNFILLFQRFYEMLVVARWDKITLKKRFLFLLLHNSYWLNDDQTDQAAGILEIEACWLKERVFFIKESLRSKTRRYQTILQRLNRLSFQKTAREEGLRWGCKLDPQFEGIRSRISECKKNLNMISFHASNRIIGLALGVPKGTVDTGMSRLKKMIQGLYLSEENRYSLIEC